MPSYAAIEDFIADVKAIQAADSTSGDVLERRAAAMRDLVRSPVVDRVHDALAGNIHHGRQSGPLYTDETGLTLVRGRFESDALTPIHNHGSWGIIGVYCGRDRYQTWRRVDGGDGAGSARVELVEERVLEPGDVVVFAPPLQDVHLSWYCHGASGAISFNVSKMNSLCARRSVSRGIWSTIAAVSGFLDQQSSVAKGGRNVIEARWGGRSAPIHNFRCCPLANITLPDSLTHSV